MSARPIRTHDTGRLCSLRSFKISYSLLTRDLVDVLASEPLQHTLVNVHVHGCAMPTGDALSADYTIHRLAELTHMVRERGRNVCMIRSDTFITGRQPTIGTRLLPSHSCAAARTHS